MNRLSDLSEYLIQDTKNHYVYSHRRMDKNEIFYIGVGTSDSNCKPNNKSFYKRAYQKSRRNQYWKNIVALNPDYKIEIICENFNYKCIKEVEEKLIDFYGRKDLKLGTLANMTDGGEHNTRYIKPIEVRQKHSNTVKGKRPSKECFEALAIYNKNIPKEVREKLGKDKMKPIIDINTNKIYESIGILAKELKIAHSTLSGYLLGKRKNNKYKNFKYLNN